jgi:hypothetical protein
MFVREADNKYGEEIAHERLARNFLLFFYYYYYYYYLLFRECEKIINVKAIAKYGSNDNFKFEDYYFICVFIIF